MYTQPKSSICQFYPLVATRQQVATNLSISSSHPDIGLLIACYKFFVRLHGEYNASLALWKHHVSLLLPSFRSVSSDLHQC